jgi:spoIIIJ-associated protein
MIERRPPSRKPAQRQHQQREHRSGAQTPLPRLDSERAIREVTAFLEQTKQTGQFAWQWEISTEPGAEDGHGSVMVAFRGEDEGLLLERNAELLLALEYIAHRWLRLDPRLHDRVRFDCGGYRAERLDELKLSARVAAQRVRETGEAFRFNPMSSRERRLIHLELAGAAGVRTVSEGSGDRRQLVIYPATMKK